MSGTSTTSGDRLDLRGLIPLAEKWKHTHCPMILGERGPDGKKMTQCAELVTKTHFSMVCNTPNFSICNHYSQIINGLKEPIDWFMILASSQPKEKDPNISP